MQFHQSLEKILSIIQARWPAPEYMPVLVLFVFGRGVVRDINTNEILMSFNNLDDLVKKVKGLQK